MQCSVGLHCCALQGCSHLMQLSGSLYTAPASHSTPERKGGWRSRRALCSCWGAAEMLGCSWKSNHIPRVHNPTAKLQPQHHDVALSTTSTSLLNTSLGSLFQYLITLSVRTFFLTSNLNPKSWTYNMILLSSGGPYSLVKLPVGFWLLVVGDQLGTQINFMFLGTSLGEGAVSPPQLSQLWLPPLMLHSQRTQPQGCPLTLLGHPSCSCKVGVGFPASIQH